MNSRGANKFINMICFHFISSILFIVQFLTQLLIIYFKKRKPVPTKYLSYIAIALHWTTKMEENNRVKKYTSFLIPNVKTFQVNQDIKTYISVDIERCLPVTCNNKNRFQQLVGEWWNTPLELCMNSVYTVYGIYTFFFFFIYPWLSP